MSTKLQILLPMGGLGQRFRDEGYTTPKPLIEVEGRRMFMRALDSFNGVNSDKSVMFIVRQDAEEEYGLATSINELMPNAQVKILSHNTRGAAETALQARDIIDPDSPLIIMDCDFEFTSQEYFNYVEQLVKGADYDGVLLSFNSDDPRYSYAKVGTDGYVIETAEKKVISNHALWGAYCFAHGGLFIEYADRLLAKGLSEERKEFYISYVYSEMIADGRKIKLATADSSNSFGTPVELNGYLESRK